MSELASLFAALGRGPEERTTVCVKPVGGAFRSIHCTVAEAPAIAERHHGDDVWFAVQPLRPDIGSGRGKAEDVIGLRALYADIDFKDTGMGASSAWALVKRLGEVLGSPPAAVVLSGHGLQPYWPLRADWAPDDARARALAVSLLDAWRAKVEECAAELDGAVDPVFDLPRILRAPGSVNVKDPAAPIPTRMHLGAGTALDGAEVERRLLTGRTVPAPRKSTDDVWASIPDAPRTFTDAEALAFVAPALAKLRGAVPKGSPSVHECILYASPILGHFPNHFTPQQIEGMVEAELAKAGSMGLGASTHRKTLYGGLAKGEADWVAERVERSTFVPDDRPRNHAGVWIVDGPWHMDKTGGEPSAQGAIWLETTGLRLHYWRGSFYRYSSGQWKPFEDGEMDRILRSDLGHATIEVWDARPKTWETRKFNPNIRNMGEVRKALRDLCYRETHWTTDRAIVFANGSLDVTTGELLPHDPAVFNLHKIRADYDTSAAAPSWAAFLGSSLPEADQRARLQEVLGYLIAGRQDLHKIFGIWGPPRSGKSTFMRVLEAILGQSATAAPSLAALTTGFGLASSRDASVIRIDEARFSRQNKAVLDVLLKISGNDSVEINEKNKPQYSARIPGRIVMISNEMPNVKEDSGALAKRFVHLRFGVSFYGREDHGLTDRLLGELPGIVAWAMKGLERLDAQGGTFTSTASADRMERSLLLYASNMEAWWTERVLVDGVTQCPAAVLYADYVAYCEDNYVEVSHVASGNRLGRFMSSKDVESTTARVDGVVQKVREGARLHTIGNG